MVWHKEDNAIRVMSWNVRDFLDSQIYTDTPGNKRREIFALITKASPDILCIQDCTDQQGKDFRSSINDVVNAGNFPNYYYNVDFSKQYYYAFSRYGTAVLSKYPIIDSGRIQYTGRRFPESLAYVKIKMNNDTLCIFTTHLRSMNLNFDPQVPGPYDMLEGDSTFIVHSNKLQKLYYFDTCHIKQVQIAKTAMNACKYPFIFCADLNSVPSGYVYHHLSKGLTDAFVAKGSGIGGTYDGISPTLRIDVMLMTKDILPIQYYSPQLHASDHFPLIVDIKLKK